MPTPPRNAALAAVTALGQELARLVIPVACPGCGERDVQWCRSCVEPFLRGDQPPKRVETAVPRLDRLDGTPPLPVWAIADYDGPARQLIVHWKDHGRADLDRIFVPAAAAATRDIAPRSPAAADTRLFVVPAPSTASSLRTRGRVHLDPLVAAVVAELRQSGWSACKATVLRKARSRDQVGLGARSRGANTNVTIRRHALARIQRRSSRAASAASQLPTFALLIDDVVTTGATLAAAQTALLGEGIIPLGALVLAAVPAPGAA